MNFFKRATISILRRPGKTIILLLLVFILGTVIAGAIAVEGAISNTDANLRANMPAIVTTTFDQESFMTEVDWEDDYAIFDQYWNDRELLTADHVRTLGELDYVESYDYIIEGWLATWDLERYEGDHDFITHSSEGEDGPNHIRVLGASDTELVHVQNDIISITEGNTFSEADLSAGDSNRSVAIISEALASANNLSVGSTFTFSQTVSLPLPAGEWHEPWTDQFLEENVYDVIEIEYEVIGLFDINEERSTEDDQWEQIDRLNVVYIPNWTIESINRQSSDAHIASWESVDFDPDPDWHGVIDVDADEDERETEVIPVFVLTDPVLIDDFRVAAEEFLPPFYNLIDMSGAFGDIASSMDTLQGIANWVLYVSIGATLLILSLLITLFLRDRRYEMGVYLALGEKKGRVIAQILMEVIVTSLVGITLAVFTGTLISNAVSQNMLRNQLISQQDEVTMWGGGHHTWDPESSAFEQIGIPRISMTPEEMMEAFEISFSLETIGLFYIIGLGAVGLSTVMPVIYVVTLKPKKVLM